MSSTGRCFDIGNATSDALHRFMANGNPHAGSTNPRSAGNGCIMRLAPVPIMFTDTPAKAAFLSGEQSRTTHGAVECIEASRLFGAILATALQGRQHKTEVFLPDLESVGPITSPRLKEIASGVYFERTQSQIRGTGYVVDSLEAALWCFHSTDNFRDAVLAAANLGDDADTTAAITGQVAGAFYGEAKIPQKWIDAVTMSREIGEMAEQLSQATEQ